MRPLGAEARHLSLPLASRPAHPGVGDEWVILHSFAPTPTSMAEVAMPLCFRFRSQKAWPEDLSSDASFWFKKVGLQGVLETLEDPVDLFPCARPCTARQIVAQRGKGLIQLSSQS